MRKLKNKRNEQQLIDDQSSYSIKSVIIIIIIIILVLAAFYYITTVVVDNQAMESQDEEVVTEEYQSEKILFGQMLSRKESEYYVYAYDENSKFYDLYENYMSDYSSKDNALPIYRIDINDGMNKSYIGSQNIVKDTLDDLQINGITLFKVKNGKIADYYNSSEDIADALKN